MKGLKRFLKSQDAYGQHISLTYKRRTIFPTLFGGIATIASRVGLFVFLILLMRQLVDKKSSIARQINSTDVVREPDNFTMNYTNFQMAMKLSF